ncbi:pyridine nucleotide-disulfide oxidoreductase-domain-containing protein [Mucor mucedo]|uniref:pyridine nucleotide-disulfide oxidoreductase-domain-containing protein n=1 Tax=Mucor mucedo TaxID=29922 RepID=UPI00221E70E4|nr:pyridine nucleotide-disulfide oxidoreductase-domain-containing protein [Mucor mucedo]KAI7892974.1 pyridine nucleotide-disulfide oxidoreductase-domain-containing protein [Mucor mucedo]
MFSRLTKRVKNVQEQQKVFFTTNRKTPWINPKVKKAVLLSTGAVCTGTGAYYLLTDRERRIPLGVREKVPSLAIYPDRGGVKELPITTHYLEDSIDKENTKPRLVIIGSGWGAVSVLKNLDKDKYNVTIVSENNYFLFTPLLPSATVGTLELRSLIESVRKIAHRIGGHFLEGKALDIDLDNKLLEVEGCHSGEKHFYVPYDKLIVAVGATSMTHGVQGIENTMRLKTIRDAMDIRRKVTENVEKACLPTTSPEERKQLLSFVVCGGGPTGVEFAAEMSDWINEDLVEWFPKVLREEISIHIIQSRDHILNTFDSKISDYAEKKFDRERVNVITNARVDHIEKDNVVYKLKSVNGSEPVTKSLPYGLCLWSTGIAMTSFAKNLTDKIPIQAHKRVLTTDGYLQLHGLDDVYALGDCATIENPKLIEHITEFIQNADTDGDGKIQYKEFLAICETMRSRFPLTEQHLTNLKTMFNKYDTDHDGFLDVQEMGLMLKDIDKNMTNLPATAQVASQQGQYLAKYLNTLSSTENDECTQKMVGPFRYSHLGTLAYLGNTAVGDFKWGYQMVGGLWALYLWRSVYWSEQVSMRTRLNLSIDWTKCAIWGRDIATV